MSKASSRPTRGSFFRRRRRVSTFSMDQEERLATVRFLIFAVLAPSFAQEYGGRGSSGWGRYLCTWQRIQAFTRAMWTEKFTVTWEYFRDNTNIIMSPKSPAWDDLVAEITGNFGLGTDTPERRSIQPAGAGKNVAFPQVGGLHHRLPAVGGLTGTRYHSIGLRR